MRKNKNKIIAGIIIVIVLAFVYWWGGNSPGLRDRTPAHTSSTETTTRKKIPFTSDKKPAKENTDEENTNTDAVNADSVNADNDVPIKEPSEMATEENKPQKSDGTPMTAEEKTQVAAEMNGGYIIEEEGDITYSEESGMEIDHNTGKDQYETDSVPEGRPIPVEPENVIISDKELTCTLSVRCDTILNNIAWLDKEKVELVPKDGVIFAEQKVTFYEGESVFNVLLREMKRNKIHMEFKNTPIYNSAYIEGIGNLYEFDCGELSGWMYSVNGWFPNYGCSRYLLKENDRVEWVYTCNLGGDVGGENSTRKGFGSNE